jgi:hypothetical protein
MNHPNRLAKAYRFLLIGSLLLTCLFFYLRKCESALPPFSSSEASALCAASPGCKSISTTWDYDIAQGRVVVNVRATLARKPANANALKSIQQAIDRSQSEQSWIRRTLWPAPQHRPRTPRRFFCEIDIKTE